MPDPFARAGVDPPTIRPGSAPTVTGGGTVTTGRDPNQLHPLVPNIDLVGPHSSIINPKLNPAASPTVGFNSVFPIINPEAPTAHAFDRSDLDPDTTLPSIIDERKSLKPPTVWGEAKTGPGLGPDSGKPYWRGVEAPGYVTHQVREAIADDKYARELYDLFGVSYTQASVEGYRTIIRAFANNVGVLQDFSGLKETLAGFYSVKPEIAAEFFMRAKEDRRFASLLRETPGLEQSYSQLLEEVRKAYNITDRERRAVALQQVNKKIREFAQSIDRIAAAKLLDSLNKDDLYLKRLFDGKSLKGDSFIGLYNDLSKRPVYSRALKNPEVFSKLDPTNLSASEALLISAALLGDEEVNKKINSFIQSLYDKFGAHLVRGHVGGSYELPKSYDQILRVIDESDIGNVESRKYLAAMLHNKVQNSIRVFEDELNFAFTNGGEEAAKAYIEQYLNYAEKNYAPKTTGGMQLFNKYVSSIRRYLADGDLASASYVSRNLITLINVTQVDEKMVKRAQEIHQQVVDYEKRTMDAIEAAASRDLLSGRFNLHPQGLISSISEKLKKIDERLLALLIRKGDVSNKKIEELLYAVPNPPNLERTLRLIENKEKRRKEEAHRASVAAASGKGPASPPALTEGVKKVLKSFGLEDFLKGLGLTVEDASEAIAGFIMSLIPSAAPTPAAKTAPAGSI